MPTAVQLLLDRHGAKAPRDDGSELPGGIWYHRIRTGMRREKGRLNAMRSIAAVRGLFISSDKSVVFPQLLPGRTQPALFLARPCHKIWP